MTLCHQQQLSTLMTANHMRAVDAHLVLLVYDTIATALQAQYDCHNQLCETTDLSIQVITCTPMKQDKP